MVGYLKDVYWIYQDMNTKILFFVKNKVNRESFKDVYWIYHDVLSFSPSRRDFMPSFRYKWAELSYNPCSKTR